MLHVLDSIPGRRRRHGRGAETIGRIRAGDTQSWHAAWSATGERVAALARVTKDWTRAGTALLRAHSHYRTAEFFLAPGDPKRRSTAQRNTAAFYTALDTLGVAYERMRVRYGPGASLQPSARKDAAISYTTPAVLKYDRSLLYGALRSFTH